MIESKDTEKSDVKTDVEKNVEIPVASPPDAAEESPQVAPDPAALAEQIAKLQAERDDLRQTLIRRQADFENHRKRIERERST